MPARRTSRRKFNPDDPRYIRNIHHYCDRWCERCEFSHRCCRYALIGASLPAGKNGESVYHALARVMEEAKFELELAGVMDTLPADEHSVASNVASEKRLQRRAHRAGARLTKVALTYARIVDEWFVNEVRAPLEYVRDMKSRVDKGQMRATDAKGELVLLNDCIEIIRWHQHLIYVKLCRAYSSRIEEESTRERGPLDSNGSAKVALVATDRSLTAWVAFREMFPEKTDTILEILVQLKRLRRMILEAFPKAPRFKRPGFDEKAPRKKSKPQ